MNSLDRKLFRDLLGMKGQAAAISLVIAAAVGTFVMALSTLESLSRTKDTYYDRYRFAHVFAQLKRAPNSLVDRIAAIPGVSQVQSRIVFDVTIDVEGLPEPAVGRLISIPERRKPVLNDLYLRRGRYIEPRRDDEVLVSEPFAESHDLEPGDKVAAIINGRRRELEIVGIVLSPEYIIQISGGSLLPDDRRFGIFWMSYDQLAAAFDMEGAFNNISLRLMRGASEPEVIQRLDDLTEAYGGFGAGGRHDQVSHHYVTEEIKQLKSMGLVTPTIFLLVATFLLNVVLTRLISIQREEIAALKAFGYTKWEVGWHYIKLVLLITSVGVLFGTLLGAWLGRNLTELYTTFYRFPVFVYELPLSVIALVVFISGSAAVLGTITAVRRAVDLPPAEAMRPEPPADFKPTIIERSGFGNWLPQTSRMILRQLERRPFKALLTSFGISLAVAVLVLGSFGEDALTYIIDFQFNQAQRQDVTVSFVEPTPGRALHDVNHLPGVNYCEPFRSVPTRFHFGHISRRVGVMGLEPDARLFRLLDENEREVALPPQGLMLSQKLAELMHVELGDVLTVEVLEGQRLVREVPVAKLITEFNGTNAYMNIHALRRLLREGNSVSGAFLAVDDDRLLDLYTTLKNTPRAAGVNIKSAAITSFEETIAENLLMMQAINVMFASVIAFGVVYNSARISLSERSRELATLRVMGFTRAEISAILLGELAVLTFIAIPVGLGLGYFFAWLTTFGLDTEVYRIPLVIDRATFGFATIVIIIAALITGLVVRRRLDHLDLVAVLKSKE